MNDALGNPIVIGNSYGTSVSYDGKHSSVVGIAERITDAGNVTLRITKRVRMERGVMVDSKGLNEWGEKAKATVSYNPGFLFPVSQ